MENQVVARKCEVQAQSKLYVTYGFFFFDMMFILVGCKVTHLGLRKLGQPRMVSQIIVYIFLSWCFYLM